MEEIKSLLTKNSELKETLNPELQIKEFRNINSEEKESEEFPLFQNEEFTKPEFPESFEKSEKNNWEFPCFEFSY